MIIKDGKPIIQAAHMLDIVLDKLQLKNDAALAKQLGIGVTQISKIRCGHIPVGNSVLICLHLASGISIRELKELAGIPRKNPHQATET